METETQVFRNQYPGDQRGPVLAPSLELPWHLFNAAFWKEFRSVVFTTFSHSRRMRIKLLRWFAQHYFSVYQKPFLKLIRAQAHTTLTPLSRGNGLFSIASLFLWRTLGGFPAKSGFSAANDQNNRSLANPVAEIGLEMLHVDWDWARGLGRAKKDFAGKKQAIKTTLGNLLPVSSQKDYILIGNSI